MNIETIAIVNRYRAKGLNSKEIGVLTGYSHRTIQGIFRTQKPTRSIQQLKNENAEVLRLYKTGHYTYKQLAERFGRSVSWIAKRVNKKQLPPTDPRQKLFNYMATEHSVLLLDTDLNYIERLFKNYPLNRKS